MTSDLCLAVLHHAEQVSAWHLRLLRPEFPNARVTLTGFNLRHSTGKEQAEDDCAWRFDVFMLFHDGVDPLASGDLHIGLDWPPGLTWKQAAQRLAKVSPRHFGALPDSALDVGTGTSAEPA